MGRIKKRFSKIIACCLAMIMTVGGNAASFVSEAYSPYAAHIKPVKVTAKNFPDDTFRAYVSSAFDTDKNGILDPDELLVARNIHCDRMGIKTLKGIEHLVELRGVYASFNELTELDLSKNPEITGVWVSNNKFTKLDFTANKKTLEWLYCFDNPTLKTLNLKGCKKMSYLECSECNLRTLDVSEFTKLEHLICASCGLSKLDLSKNINLTHLDAFNNPDNGYDYPLNNKLTKLDLSNNPKMKRLDIWANYNLKNVDISVCPGLQYYNCAMIGATKLDLSKNPELNKLNCSYNKNLTKLDLSKNPKMACLICNDCPIKSLDLTHNPYMRYLHAGLCSFTSLNIGSCPYLLKTYKDGKYEKEYMDGVPVGQSWTINYGGDDSTGNDQIFYIWINKNVKISTKATVDISDLYPDQDSNITNTKNLVTREAFVQTLYKMAGSPSVKGLKSRFKDVKAGSWYEDALKWGEKNAICVGYPYSTADVFGVGKYISRQDAVFMLMRYSELMGYERAIDFGRSDDYLDYYDVDFDHWEAICWSATWHIMEGKGAPGASKEEQRIDPYGKATRAELKEMLKNLYDVNKIKTAVPDIYKPPTVKTYTVKFVNDDGTVLQSGEVEKGKMPSYSGKTPTKSSTANYVYTFKGWDKPLAKVTGNVTYKATYIKKKINVTVTRLAGANRYETAKIISDKMYKTADTVVLATGLSFNDALVAVPLASAYDAPLLLATERHITDQTLAELKRLKAKNVIVVSTNGAIGSNAKAELKGYKATYIEGKTCFETAAKVAKALQTKTKKAPDTIFFATDSAFADALSASPVAATMGAPIIYLKNTGSIDSATANYLKSVKGKVKNAYIIGGDGVISNAMMKNVATALGLTSGKTVQRVSGMNRYETCVAVNNKFKSVLSSDGICVAKGLDFPDALAGGVYAAKNKQALFLADGKKLQDVQKTYLKGKDPTEITIFGGTGAVPDELKDEILRAIV